MGYLERYEEAFLNDYSSGIKQAIKANGSTVITVACACFFQFYMNFFLKAGGALLLERLKVKLCDVMDVEAGRQGLVAVRTVPPGQPIVEFRGQFTLNSETDLTSILSRYGGYLFILGFSIIFFFSVGRTPLCCFTV